MSHNRESQISLSKIIPLHLVAGNQSPYAFLMAKTLLERGSDPNAKDPDGVTPVHVAASWGNYETLKLLLLNGGNPELEDSDGKTALDLARQEKQTECVQLLSWWVANSKSDSKQATPASINRSAAQAESPLVFNYGSPSSPYQPKYFTSPLSGNQSSAFSAASGGSGARKAIATGLSPMVHSGTRRVLTYDVKPTRDRTDGNCSGRCTSPLVELQFERLPPTPTLNQDRIEESHEPKEDAPKKNATSSEEPVSDKKDRRISSEEAKAAKKDEKEAEERLERLAINENVDIRRLSLIDDGLDAFSQKLNETLRLDSSGKEEALAALEMTIQEENREIDPRRLSECNKMTDAELRRQATNQGMDVGPITPGTRFLYVRRLAALLSASGSAGARKGYLPELQAAVDGKLNIVKCRQDELQLRLSFDSPLNGGTRQWREGCLKMSFCYLLLDPTITMDLPARSIEMSESDCLTTFADAIFYVGKGKKSRPLQHLIEAANATADSGTRNAKIERILTLWRQGFGVISLHIFQNVIPAEAYTREAAMIDALGLDRLCNQKRGDYYGAAANWALGRRRRFGAYLLKVAASIFLLEGEKQLKRDDVSKPASA